MHSYSIDSNERKYVPFLLTLLAILLAWLLHIMLKLVNFAMPWWIDAPSVMGFYGLLCFAFDSFLWKIKVLHSIGVVRIPNFNGIWTGCVLSSFSQHGDNHMGELIIRQSWSNISIVLESDLSKSYSIAASISINNPYGTTLSYTYINEPKPTAGSSMHGHRGTCELIYRGNSFEGEYYSGRDRQNYGTLLFKKEKPKSGKK